MKLRNGVAMSFFETSKKSQSLKMLTRHQGHTLIEVLLTVVLVGVGLLGIAAMQLRATRYNHQAYLRSVAVTQAYDMLDRIRANQAGATAGNYNNISGLGAASGCSSGCSAAQIAANDQFDWNSTNARLLPSGQGTVSAASGIYTVTIFYDGDRTGVSGLGCSGNPNIDLTCIRVRSQL